MTLLKVASPPEEFDIPVPTGDTTFDPKSKGGRMLHFQRSNSTMVDGIRQQINANSAFIDASMVYSSENFRAKALRDPAGAGHLLTSENNFLPFNVNGLPNQPERTTIPTSFFLAGDVRANENSPLLIMQTLFVREHNFWADSLRRPGLERRRHLSTGAGDRVRGDSGDHLPGFHSGLARSERSYALRGLQ